MSANSRKPFATLLAPAEVEYSGHAERRAAQKALAKKHAA